MQKNYQKTLEGILKEISSQGTKKPSLLLHACCAPCSSYVLEYLSVFFNITIFYYNPNIHPQAEYQRRLTELKNFLPAFCKKNGAPQIRLVQAEYNPQEFFDAVQAQKDGLEKEAERGERCRRCYLFRMKKAYDFAVLNGFDWFTTTLSISPFKDAEKINTIGKELEESFFAKEEARTKFLPSDFKKKNGFKRSLELSKEYGLYRQDYCGCVYSKENKNAIN